MSSSFVLEVSNGVIAILTGLVLYAVAQIFRWVHHVNVRLAKIERQLGVDAPEDPDD